jgi:hypothetical protein
MAKPAITKRITKTAALTYSELDTNFQNLADATLTLRAGTGGTNVTADLNGTITLVAGTNVTLTGDNSAKTITVNSTAAGSGTVTTGTVNRLAFYPATADSVGSSRLATYTTSTTATLSAEPDTGGTLKLMSKNDRQSITLSDNDTGILMDTRTTTGGDLYLQCYNGVELNATSGAFQFRTTYSGGDFNNGIQFVGQYVQLPNRTTTQRNALTAQNGMIIYNDSTNKFQGYVNGTWVDLH